MTKLTEASRHEVAVLGTIAASNAHAIRRCAAGYKARGFRVPNLVAQALDDAVRVTQEAAEMLAPTYTIGQAARIMNHALRPMWQAHEQACAADTAISGGEWTWASTARAEALLDEAAERVLRRLGYTMQELAEYGRELEYRHCGGWFDPPMANRHDNLARIGDAP